MRLVTDMTVRELREELRALVQLRAWGARYAAVYHEVQNRATAAWVRHDVFEKLSH